MSSPSGSTSTCHRPPPAWPRANAPRSRRWPRSPFVAPSPRRSRSRVSIACSRELELPLIPVLARMEATGVALDLDALAALDREFESELTRLEAEIYADVGHEFNLGSPKQLEQVLFHELNLPTGKRTKTGYSTDATVLEELRPAHPMVGKLLDWRLYTKLRSTYVEALPGLLAADGRLHTTFHQAVAATGRLSSSDPNLQNIPIRTPLGRRIRRAFVAGASDVVLAVRRLQPDRAPDPGPRFGRRAPEGCLRARGRTSTATVPRSSCARTPRT